MNEQKIEEVFSDESFVKSLTELKTPEEVHKVLAAKGLDASVDEVKTLFTLLQKKAKGELKDEDLEAVAGGGLSLQVIKLFRPRQPDMIMPTADVPQF